MPLVDFVA